MKQVAAVPGARGSSSWALPGHRDRHGPGTCRGHGPSSAAPPTHVSETTYLSGSGAQCTPPTRTAPRMSLKRRPRFLPRMVSSVPPSRGPRSGSICSTKGQVIKSEHHRIPEQFGSEETSKIIYDSCHWQGHLPLDQVRENQELLPFIPEPCEADRITPHTPACPTPGSPCSGLAEEKPSRFCAVLGSGV